MKPIAPACLSLCALLAAPAPLAAAPRVILDYRKAQPVEPKPYQPATRQAIAKALSDGGQTALAKDFTVLGDVGGAFSGAGRKEELFLVAHKAPVAIDPFPAGPGQVLVALRDGRLSAVYRLPPQRQYQRIAAALDSDGDGVGEVLLEASAYNMGQSVTSVDLVALGQDGSGSVRQTLQDVLYDGCENPRGKKEKRASTITLGGHGKLVATAHALRCS